MAQSMVIQGRNITTDEIGLIRDLMAEHRDWGRTRLSEELCRCWNWRNAQGRIKDMAARTLLLKLQRRGCIELPARQRPSSNQFRNRRVPVVEPASEPIRGSLSDLRPHVRRTCDCSRGYWGDTTTWAITTRWARTCAI